LGPILYAPASGTETRAQIAEKANQAKDKVVEMKDTVVDKASQWKDMAASKLSGAVDATEAAYDGMKSEKSEKTPV
jgi:gas vesicle protein